MAESIVATVSNAEITALTVTLEADTTIGYASIQNDVPVIRTLKLHNGTETTLANIEVVVSCSPSFAKGARLHFSVLRPGETRELQPIDLQPDHQYLLQLNEAVQATITAQATAGGQVLADAIAKIEVLAYDQWAGARALVELIAAFVMPNAIAVDQLLGKASRLLRKVDPALSMNGYGSKNRDNVWKQISAFYSTIAAEELQYALPPASFTSDGQKVRTPDRIIKGRVATCLDTTLLFASCLEQAGLNPVLLFTENHAFVGCWLIKTSFAVATVEDVQTVRKRVQSGELLVFETTGVAMGRQASLRHATGQATEFLNEEDKFRFAIDVARARELRLRPIPSRSEQSAAGPVQDAATFAPEIEPTPELPSLDSSLLPIIDADTPIDTPEGRLAHWKRKLLDLTLRNRLLNFKSTRTSLAVLAPDLHLLEDKIAQDHEFTLRPLPPTMSGADPRSGVVHAARTGSNPKDAIALEALNRNELLFEIEDAALNSRLLEIFSAARTGLEEGGANTLYMALGMLRWQEAEKAEASHLAPIILVPVTLTRQSVRTGYRLSKHDDGTLINPTLLQLLREEYNLKLPAFDTIPTDEHGIDVNSVLQSFRLAVNSLPGWEVLGQAHLGIFSFTKYLMWKDLQDRSVRLKENRVVAHLVDHPGQAFAPDSHRQCDLDDKYRPQDLLTPLSADSSQLQALCQAADGRDFVIFGPPGTGKSQTIANLIAHFLGNGKTVLFVSEKMAALEVVHRRLKNIGLDPFCLELHSAKARKADIVQQLGKALDAAGTQSSEAWAREAERLAVLRQSLNSVVRALHKVHGNGLSVFSSIGTAIKHRHQVPAQFSWPNPDKHSREELDALRETARQMQALSQALPGLSTHPLRLIGWVEWSHAWQDEWCAAVDKTGKAAEAFDAIARWSLKIFGLTESGQSVALYASLDHLTDILLKVPAIVPGIATRAFDEKVRAKIDKFRVHKVRRDRIWAQLAPEYNESVVRVDAALLIDEWAATAAKWFLPRWLKQRALCNRLATHLRNKGKISAQRFPDILDTLAKLNAEDRELAPLQPEVEPLLGELYSGSTVDWAAVERQTQWGAAFANAVARFYSAYSASQIAEVQQKLAVYFSEHRTQLAPEGTLGKGFVQYRECYRIFQQQLDCLTKLAAPIEPLCGTDDAAGALPRLSAAIGSWQQNRRLIKDWCYWRRTRNNALQQGLESLVFALEQGKVELSKIADYFEYSYQYWWLRRTIDREPVLRDFRTSDHQRKIEEFRATDQRYQKLTQHQIVAILSQKVPTATSVAPSADSEMGKLRRELQKQKKHLPIRQLIQGIPTLLPKLKPCLLMSPLSVAQYLDASCAPFDIVIFDEASQIPVWDAVGVIARAQQLIVVGDPKQLPPTNFFQRTDDGTSDDATFVEDLESILDECLGAGLFQLSLEWHYRSRHESLITFSNIMYYQSQLITFPSPVTDDVAVRFEHIPGVYDRGGSRTNRTEAEAVVSAIERHFLDPAMAGMSVGVVTFNQPQQLLIEQLLDARRRDSNELDQLLDTPRGKGVEPLFIKNLENVQGDERDYIFFSITYGSDKAGRTSMNFGPLNLEGGERRLNVAVSRAREGVVVFSSLLPDQIDLSRVRAAGARDLKHYLEFAISGPKALIAKTCPTGLEPESPFELLVMQSLRSKGWDVHAQVGCSCYRIDLAVVDPRAPGRYLLGIECDGRSYHSAATARDRDRLRQAVLEGLGWQIYRIWSTDWWHDAETETERLHAKLTLLAEAPVTPAQHPTPPASPVEVNPAAEKVPIRVQPSLPVYRPTTINNICQYEFHHPASSPLIEGQVATVIASEGPIEEGQLFQRITRAWGLNRTGNRIADTIRDAAASKHTTTEENGVRFYWPAGAIPDKWDGFRVADEEHPETERHVTTVCQQELGNLALHVLDIHGSMGEADLARTVARFIGMARLPVDGAERMTSVLDWLGKAGRIVRTGDRIQRS